MNKLVYTALFVLGACLFGAGCATAPGPYGYAGGAPSTSLGGGYAPKASVHPWCDNPKPGEWRQCSNGN